MRFSEILNASILASFAAAHGSGIPGAPKIVGLPAEDIAALRSRNTIFGRHDGTAHPAHGSQLQARQGGDANNRCGKNFGCAVCDPGNCCSLEGYCGQGPDFCQAPDSQFEYGPAADANQVPPGGSTLNTPRNQVGSVPYGGDGIYACQKPGQIAITYDDGPYTYTSDLLDMYKSYGFKATFFVTGININKGRIDDTAKPWPGMIQRMYNEGHQVASHTWSHQDLSAITSSQRYDQMIRLEMALANIIGKIPTYMRPPYSSCTAASGCEKDLADLGYHISYFDLDTDDYNNATPEKQQNAKNNFYNKVNPSNSASDEFLAIAHDIHFQTVYNLTGYMLDLMVKKGYKGVSIGECLGDAPANWYRNPAARVASTSSFSPPACAPTSASLSASASGSNTASAATASATGLSTDGSCGSTSRTTCLGFVTDEGAPAECCSQHNFCGSTEGHCGAGCQAGFGKCGLQSSSPSASGSVSVTATSRGQAATPTAVSPDASCGPTNGYTCRGYSLDGVLSECCSQHGYCGSTDSYCGTGCQAGFGKCGISSSSAVLSSVGAFSSVSSSGPVLAASSSPVAASSSAVSISSSRVSSSVVASSSSPASSSVISSSDAQPSSSIRSSSSPSSSSVALASSSWGAQASSSPVALTSSSWGAQASSSPPVMRSSSAAVSSVSSSSSLAISSSTPSAPSPSSKSVWSSTPASSPLASSTISSSAASASPTLKTSPNGTCGPWKGYSCLGYRWGECCSKVGLCGSTILHCGPIICDNRYGKCA